MHEYPLVEQIVLKELGCPCRRVSRVLGKGSVNDVFVAETPSFKLVVRTSPEHNVSQYKKELWASNAARSAGIPTPRVIASGVHRGTLYMITDFVRGTEGDLATVFAYELWVQLGKYARVIHSIHTEGFGDRIVRPGHFDASWQRHLDFNIRSLAPGDVLERMGVLSADQSRSIRSMLRGLQDAKFSFALNHGDLSLKNVIIADDGIVHLLDWGSAESHIVPHFDFVEVLESSFRCDYTGSDFLSFAGGYGLDERSLSNMKPEINALMTLRAIDKLRWAIDRRPERVGPLETLLSTVLSCTLG